MLLWLLSLFSIHCPHAEQATISKTPLSELMQKSILEMDSLLNDFQQEIRKEQSVLQAVDQEIQDVVLPDYSLTPAGRGGSSGANHTGNHTRPTLFPYPPGHFTTTTKDPWESWNLPGLHYTSPSDPLSYVPSPGHMPDLGYPLNQTTPFYPHVKFDRTKLIYGPTDMNYSASFTRPSFPFHFPPRTKHTSLKPKMDYISFNVSYSPNSPTFRLPTKNLLPQPGFMRSVTTRAKARTLSKWFAMSDLHRVERERSWYRPRGERLTKANRMRATTRRPQPQLRKRTLSKAQAWVQNRGWMKNKAGRTPQRHMRQGNHDPLTKPTPITVGDPMTIPPAVSGGDPMTTPPAVSVGGPMTTPPAVSVGGPMTTPPAVSVDNSLPIPTPISVDNNLTSTPPLPDGYTESYVSFSMPGLSDILPSMSVPGLEEASLTIAASVSETPSTTFDPLHVKVTVTETAFTEALIQEDHDGFLFVKSPATIPVLTTETTTNTIGQVLLHAEIFTTSTPPPEPLRVFHELMERLDEGYLTIFLMELARLIAQKAHEHVQDVFEHFEIIYNKMYEQGTLVYFGEQILELGSTFSHLFSGHDISLLQTRANMMHAMLQGRAQYVSVQVNSIIDYADMMFEDDEGDQLFDALLEFQAFPNVTAGSYDVCSNLIMSFLKPFQRLRGTKRLQKLVDSVLTVAAAKFSHRRRSDTATREQNQTKNKTKRNPPSLRRRIETKRLQMMRRRRQPANQYKLNRRQVYDANPPVVRDMLPITKHQKRFRVIAPKQLRSNAYMGMLRPTQAYFRRRLGRPVHAQGGVLPMFPQVREVELKRRVQTTDAEPQHLKESARPQTLRAMREEVRRIVEESSYSDEEASLKMNLRHALRVNWHRTHTPP